MKKKNEFGIYRSGQKQESHWYYKCCYKGERPSFDLGTSVKVDALKKAKEIYHFLQAHGLADTLREYKHKKAAPKGPVGPVLTVGEFLAAFDGKFDIKRTTFTAYCQDLRRVVCDLAGLPRLQTNNAKHNAEIIPKIDEQPLSILTRSRVYEWRQKYLAEDCGPDPVSQGRGKIRANQVLNHCSAMFSQERQEVMQEVMGPAMENPFSVKPLNPGGVKLKRFSEPHCHFKPIVDIRELFAKAMQLKDEEKKKAFVLLLCAGLRRAEADTLTWDQIVWDANKIRVETTKYIKLKVETAAGEVPVDPPIMDLLRKWSQAPDRDPVFVLKGGSVRLNHKRASYRANLTFKHLIDWLKVNRVYDQKPIHYLRKACGSLVCERKDIYQAKEMLRHARVRTTEAHYVTKGCTTTVGLSLSGGPKVIEDVKFNVPPAEPPTEVPEQKTENHA